MQKFLDKIQFETRGEIQEIMKMIEKYKEEHPEEENRILKRFYDLLDLMEMEW